ILLRKTAPVAIFLATARSKLLVHDLRIYVFDLSLHQPDAFVIYRYGITYELIFLILLNKIKYSGGHLPAACRRIMFEQYLIKYHLPPVITTIRMCGHRAI